MSKVDILVNYPMVLEVEEVNYFKALVKMYQILYDIEEVQVKHSTPFFLDIHYVEVHNGTETVKFHWFEFMVFDLVDVITEINTILTGTYVPPIKRSEFINHPEISTLWEQLEDLLGDFEYTYVLNDDKEKITLVHKLFRNMEYHIENNGGKDINFFNSLDKMKGSIEEYYDTYILDKESKKEDVQISAGVIPSIAPVIPLTQANESSIQDYEKEKEEEEEEKESDVGESRVVSLVKSKFVKEGVYET